MSGRGKSGPKQSPRDAIIQRVKAVAKKRVQATAPERAARAAEAKAVRTLANLAKAKTPRQKKAGAANAAKALMQLSKKLPNSKKLPARTNCATWRRKTPYQRVRMYDVGARVSGCAPGSTYQVTKQWHRVRK